MPTYYIKKLPKRRKFSKRLPYLLLLATIVLFGSFFYKPKTTDNSPQSFPTPPKVIKPIAVKKNGQIQTLLESEANKLPGRYGVVIKNLNTNTIYKLNENDIFATASLYKLAIMYKTYDLLEKGELKKDELLPESTLTVNKALTAMITYSDNDSALLLAQAIGWDKINSFIKNQGITGFNLVNNDLPETSAMAIEQILEKIYNNTAVSASASSEMKLLLFGQQINDRIPKYFPDNIKVAHKTGELDNYRNDAGIILGTKSQYIFVFLSETPAPGDAVENIAKLSKTMFDALETS